jgi:hypothetical protein
MDPEATAGQDPGYAVNYLLMATANHHPAHRPARPQIHCDHSPSTTVINTKVPRKAAVRTIKPRSPGISILMLFLVVGDSDCYPDEI